MLDAGQRIVLPLVMAIIGPATSPAAVPPSGDRWPPPSAVISRPALCKPEAQAEIRPLRIAATHWGGAYYPGDDERRRRQLLRDIAVVHAVGAEYIGSVNGRGFHLNGMDSDAVRLLNGKPMVHPPMNNAVFKCSLNPRVQQALLDALDGCVDLGMDGVILDSWQGEGWTLCFCDSCVRFYRQCLEEHRNDPRLTALGDVDPKTFDYGGYLRDRGFGGSTPVGKLPAGPAFAQWRSEELIRRKRELLEKVRRYAAGRGKARFHVTANVYSMPAPTFSIADLLDYFSVELPYFGTFDGYPPRGTSIALLKKGAAADRRCVVQPGCHDTARALIGKSSSANLFKIWIAEAYATGNLFDLVPREFAGYENAQIVWLDLPVRQLVPYYRFVQAHPEIYARTTSIARTAVLYSMAAAEPDAQEYEQEYRAICKLLYDSHRQFDVILAGDGRSTVEPSVEVLARYDAVVVIRPQCLRAETVTRLLEWRTPARQVILCGVFRSAQSPYSRLCKAVLDREVPPTELPSYIPYVKAHDQRLREAFEKTAGPDGFVTTNAPATVGIGCRQADSRTLVHLINYEYDKDSDQVRDVDGIELRLTVRAGRAFLWSPDEQGRKELSLQRGCDGLRLVVPRLHIYGVIVLEQGGPPSD